VDEIHGDASVLIRGIRHDSRKVQAGDLFVAIEGEHTDGADHAADAVKRGASAVLADHTLDVGVPVAVVPDVLVALSDIARRLYGDPTASLPVVGITGTNGKTTVAYLLEAILHATGQRPAVIGTVDFRGPGGTRPATHTTPMADDMMRLACWALETGASHLVLEVSSHGLAMHRVDGVAFDVAAFTNLSQDHLDYHGDLAGYEAAKRRLFDALSPKACVVNIDDPAGARIAADITVPLFRCSRRADADAELRVLSFTSERGGIVARLCLPDGERDLSSPLIGEHNLENLLVALGCALALGLDTDACLTALAAATGAPGRLERIEHPDDVLVFVDYAHTPDALARVLEVLRPITEGKLWALFGCGGDRDAAKRPLMGRAVAEAADALILTNDNPRSESPRKILAQIEVGVRDAGKQKRKDSTALRDLAGGGYLVEADRRRAIALCIAAAAAGDTVLIAGKGHEKVQIIGQRREPFDDCAVARQAIAKLQEVRA